MSKQYDRRAEDLGNVVGLEHVNLQVEDQARATLFYISGLGLTRDPFMMTSIDNMWVNVGRSQFHLVTGTAQHLRGHVGLVVPDRAALLRRLENVRKPLAGTKFDFVERADHVEATCPWGNRFRCHDPAPRFGRINLGMPYVAFDVPVGAARGIADFYGRTFGAASFSSRQFAGRGHSEGLLCERFGALTFAMALVPEDGRLTLVLRRWSAFGIPLPMWLCPRSSSYESTDAGRFRFHVEIGHRLTGPIVRYRGWLAR